MTNEEIIAVLKAHSKGETVQVRTPAQIKWVDYSSVLHPPRNFSDWEWRVKPQPREWWINVYSNCISDAVMHNSKLEANEGASTDRTECVHVREVLD